jgi:hypothetical protein
MTYTLMYVAAITSLMLNLSGTASWRLRNEASMSFEPDGVFRRSSTS